MEPTRILQLLFAVALGFASIVEWAHVKTFLNDRDWPFVATTAIAAVATGFIAAEALRGEWPSW